MLDGTLTVTFLSDACLTAPENIDPSVDIECATDELGLPRMPGKTIKGLFRDIWLSSCQHLDPSLEGRDLFGEPFDNEREPLLYIGDALLPETVRAEVKRCLENQTFPIHRSVIANAFFNTRKVTAIDYERGAPKDETLRVIRTVPKDTVLEAPIFASAKLTKDQHELLTTLAKLVRHAGAERNRGLGLIKIEISWKDSSKSKFTGIDKAGLYPVTLRLRSPMVLKKDALDENSVETLDFVPASTLRGAVVAAMMAQGIEADQVRKVAAGDGVEFLDAMPSSKGWPAYPAPSIIRRDKDAARDDWDEVNVGLIGDGHTEDNEGIFNQRQPLQSRYLAFDGVRWKPVDVRKEVQVHLFRHRPAGVPIKNKSAPFVYHCISAGQEFCSFLDVKDAQLGNTIAQVMSTSRLRLGRSRNAQYGGMPEFEIGVPVKKPWHYNMKVSKGEEFMVLATSDVSARHVLTGEHDPSVVTVLIEDRFKEKAVLSRFYIRMGTRKGYNRKWRSSLPDLPVVLAGSAWLMRATTDLVDEDFIQLCRDPIGESTGEGLGRIAPVKPSTFIEKPDGPRETETSETVQTREQLITAQKRAFKQVALIEVANHAVSMAEKAKNRPTPSLVQRLRTALRSEGWKRTFEEYQEAALKNTARDPIDKCRIDQKSLREHLLAEPQYPDKFAQIRAANTFLTNGDEAKRLWQEVLTELQPVYMDRFLDALAKRDEQSHQETQRSKEVEANGYN